MKKILLIFLAVIALGCIGTYVFIPGKLTITSAAVMAASENGTHRFILDKSNWRRWWNYGDTAMLQVKEPGDSFIMNGDRFALTEPFYKSAKIQIRHDQRVIETNLILIPLQIDSTGIEWKYAVTTSANPLKRFRQYTEAKEIKKNMDKVLSHLAAFLSKIDNVYGIHIEKTSVKDTLLALAKSELSTYPGNRDIYQLIQKIQTFIKTQGAVQNGSPIFNVTELEKNRFQLMCAVPIDKVITGNNTFSFKRMVRGNFMVSEVTGGDSTVKKASASLQQFFEDYHKTSMAINFTMLITDRMYQPDTAKWITKLYFPVY